MNIEVNCSCGETLDTGIKDNFDLNRNCEDWVSKEISCNTCGAKYRVNLHVDILKEGKL
jgi:hypothetical protein